MHISSEATRVMSRGMLVIMQSLARFYTRYCCDGVVKNAFDASDPFEKRLDLVLPL